MIISNRILTALLFVTAATSVHVSVVATSSGTVRGSSSSVRRRQATTQTEQHVYRMFQDRPEVVSQMLENLLHDDSDGGVVEDESNFESEEEGGEEDSEAAVPGADAEPDHLGLGVDILTLLQSLPKGNEIGKAEDDITNALAAWIEDAPDQFIAEKDVYRYTAPRIEPMLEVRQANCVERNRDGSETPVLEGSSSLFDRRHRRELGNGYLLFHNYGDFIRSEYPELMNDPTTEVRQGGAGDDGLVLSTSKKESIMNVAMHYHTDSGDIVYKDPYGSKSGKSCKSAKSKSGKGSKSCVVSDDELETPEPEPETPSPEETKSPSESLETEPPIPSESPKTEPPVPSTLPPVPSTVAPVIYCTLPPVGVVTPPPVIATLPPTAGGTLAGTTAPPVIATLPPTAGGTLAGTTAPPATIAPTAGGTLAGTTAPPATIAPTAGGTLAGTTAPPGTTAPTIAGTAAGKIGRAHV